MTFTSKDRDLASGSRESTGTKVDEVEASLGDHIEVCGKRHAVINTKLDGLHEDVREVRGLVLELVRHDGKQDAEIKNLKAAKEAGAEAGTKAGAKISAAICGGLAGIGTIAVAILEALK